MKHPFVSVIIPMFNEQENIRRCILSLSGGDYPSDRIEFIVVDGGSTDLSKLVVEELKLECRSSIFVIDNPKKIQSEALNIGFDMANGEIVIRADAHASFCNTYISTLVNTLQNTNAINVGGMARPYGTTCFGHANAICWGSSAGSGGATWRNTKSPMIAETVPFGAWWKKDVMIAGKYDSRWKVNEDYEFNLRLRKTGRPLLIIPNIFFRYRVRETPSQLFKQNFRYGFWRFRTITYYPSSIKFRQIAPLGLLLGLLCSLVLSRFYAFKGLVLPLIYISYLLFNSFSLSRGAKRFPWPPILLALLLIHFGYGCGSFFGIIYWPIERLKTRLEILLPGIPN